MIKVNKQIGHALVQFTPAFYKRAKKNAENGNYKELIGLMQQAEDDTHVSGCLVGRRAGFLREWSISEFSDSSRDEEIRDFVRDTLNQLNMRELFEDIQEARLKKFSVVGLEWEVRNNKQVIVKTERLDQRFFAHDPKDDFKLKIDAKGGLQEIPEAEALINESSRKPVLMPVLRDFILKEFGVNAWSSFLETFGEPWIIGKYPQGAGESFREELEKGVNAIGQNTRGIAPKDSDIDIIETTRGTGDHKDYTERADRGISIALLGHANAVQDSGGTQIGENLTGYKVKREIAVGDIYYIENRVQQVVRWLVDRNYGGDNYPIFSIDKSEPIDVAKRLNTLDLAYRMGMQVDPQEFAKLGLKVQDDQELLVKQPNLLDFD